MDYKKKYEQALSKARQFSEKPLLEDSAGIVEYIFPELAESEDEMTRKELKHYLEAKRKQVVDNDLPDQEYRDCTRFIAWLEAISKKETMFQNKLSEDEKIRRELIEHVIWSEDNQDISTDEMERWLAWLEKQASPVLSNSSIIGKNAWSEEDEVKINRIVACLENLNVADNDILLKDIDWLKSLKDGVQPQPSWDQEDEETLKLIKFAVLNLPSQREDTRLKCFNWLESLKDRVK